MHDEIQRRLIPGTLIPPGVNITSHPRCGDTDRERAADRVSEAYARGFLDKAEAEARHDAISQAILAEHLNLLTDDIPAISRWRGASLPTHTQSRAEQWTRWWKARQPWSGLAALLAGLISGITPTVTAHLLHLGVWTGISAGTTIPVGAVAVLGGICSLMAWSVEI